MFSALTQAVQQALQTKCALRDVAVEWRRPHDPSHGDIATALGLQLAKQLKKKPQEIAHMLVDALSGITDVERAEVAGPGYVNVWLKPQALIAALDQTRSACTAKVLRKKEAPVIVEYSSPNIAKPLGVHHILTTMIGQVITNLYRHQGFNVVTVNHIGDWGTQFGKMAVAYERWKEKPLEQSSVDDLLALYVRFHDEAELDPSLEDKAREAFQKLEQGDKELRSFWKTVVDISMREIHALYDRLHVHIEHDHGESMYQDLMMPILEEGKKKGVFVEGKRGALVVEFPQETKLSTAIVLKADGATIYHTRDLAVIRYRIDRWHPQAMLYVVGAAQQLFFQQLFAMVRMLGWDLPHMEHLSFGQMRFVDSSMSTRKGNILKLEDVLDEAVRRAEEVISERGDAIQTDNPEELATMMGIGAVVYGTLSQSRKMDIIFDWDKMLSFEGNSAPYLQYTHARARSVLRKAGMDTSSVQLPSTAKALVEHERILIGLLLLFSDVLEEARTTHMPHILANYLFDLCQEYNAFYNAEPILKAEEPTRTLRLALTALTADVLRAGAELLTLRVPDRM